VRVAVLVVAAFAAGAVVTTALAGDTVLGGKTPLVELRPTGVGLPDIGAAHTYGVAEMPAEVRAYHDSGRYDSDLEAIAGKAQSYLRKQLDRLRHNPEKGTYEKCKRKRGTRRCKPIRPAVVFDIDETSLSNYRELNEAEFASSALAIAVVEADSPAIQPTLNLFRFALGRDVSAFFVTGRPPGVRSFTEDNLRAAGYEGWSGLEMKPPDGITTLDFKRGAREEIEDEGFKILVNIGDQDSDLDGGAAKRAFKLPNPMYYIPNAS
jgi:HAD superfamily, subfamily IIIB (Acid phosphatase)